MLLLLRFLRDLARLSQRYLDEAIASLGRESSPPDCDDAGMVTVKWLEVRYAYHGKEYTHVVDVGTCFDGRPLHAIFFNAKKGKKGWEKCGRPEDEYDTDDPCDSRPGNRDGRDDGKVCYWIGSDLRCVRTADRAD